MISAKTLLKILLMFSLIGRRYKMILKLILGYSYVINSPRSLIDSLKNKLNWSIGIMKKKREVMYKRIHSKIYLMYF